MNIKALKLKDIEFGNRWFEEVEDHWDYADMQAHEDWRNGWISFDCALYSRDDDRVYTGITCFNANEIFKAYDRKTRTFIDLGYHRVADPFDAKFHRSLEQGADGSLYAAIALLHDLDRFSDAPGGAIVKYDPRSGHIEKLAVPVPHTYIQSMALDTNRNRAYGLCFPPEKLIGYDLSSGTVTDYGLISTGIGGMGQGENVCLDDEGGVWCNWQLTRAWQNENGVDAQRLCRIDPESDRIVFYQDGLPTPDGAYGTVKAEGLFNFHDGALYASGANGSLYRIDPSTGKASYLFTPIPDRPSRLASMTLAPDGYAYGVTGRNGQCELLRFDFRNTQYELLGPVVGTDGETCWQVHDICAADDGVLYACENDNPRRSGYLWEIAL